MFDQNFFKKSIKQWIRDNPEGTIDDIIDYCEEQIPPSMYASNQWLVNQTVEWYKHILAHRKAAEHYSDDDEAAV